MTFFFLFFSRCTFSSRCRLKLCESVKESEACASASKQPTSQPVAVTNRKKNSKKKRNTHPVVFACWNRFIGISSATSSTRLPPQPATSTTPTPIAHEFQSLCVCVRLTEKNCPSLPPWLSFQDTKQNNVLCYDFCPSVICTPEFSRFAIRAVVLTLLFVSRVILFASYPRVIVRLTEVRACPVRVSRPPRDRRSLFVSHIFDISILVI